MSSVITDAHKGKHMPLGLCGLIGFFKNKLSDSQHKIKGSEFNRVEPLVLIPPYV